VKGIEPSIRIIGFSLYPAFQALTKMPFPPFSVIFRHFTLFVSNYLLLLESREERRPRTAPLGEPQGREEASDANPGQFQGVTPKAGLSNFTSLRRAWSTISAT